MYVENFLPLFNSRCIHSARFRQTIGQVRSRATARGSWLASLSYWLADTWLQILAGTPHNNRCGVWSRSFVCDNVSRLGRALKRGWKLEQLVTTNFRLTIGFVYALDGYRSRSVTLWTRFDRGGFILDNFWGLAFRFFFNEGVLISVIISESIERKFKISFDPFKSRFGIYCWLFFFRGERDKVDL